MVNPCEKAKFFSGSCQMICNVFSSSTKWWSVLLDYINELTLKSLCATRWESHVESVKAMKTQLSQTKEALNKLAKVSDDGKLCKDALPLVNVSNKLQSNDMLIDVAINFFWKDWLVILKIREKSGFENAIFDAEQIAEITRVEPEFPVKCATCRKKTF
ncbi:zinc finger MYM-type protein 1 [Artemisia annua]|uniref:Zinc finger MYM-type protein 1 n=1 Tax=Artemisia annua TaxID=35608 RepID=A0A2U1LDM4_ARTAN|nr:zinc finger MYM-type protein 1 [Artemisia annua]